MKTPCLVVFDTNVWVSALFWGGIPNQLIQLWREEKIQPVFSEEIFNEWLKEVGKKAKIFQQEEKFLQYLRLIKKWATFVRIKERVAVCPHEPDNRFLEAALAGRAKVIISGDKHLLELKEFRGIEIKSPREFLQTSKF